MKWFEWSGLILPSAIALYVAIYAYPNQKEYDRENEVQREVRESYRNYVKATDEAVLLVSEVDATPNDTSDLVARVLGAHAKIRLETQALTLLGEPEVLSERPIL
ncbi:hypothetical protein QCN27_06495 [Cereibacter sp. SYSU M97828]|nr:hypothetical protein [Cereibacter flavus]